MRKDSAIQFKIRVCVIILFLPMIAQTQQNDVSFLKQDFDLARSRSDETHFYVMTSECINYALDGQSVGTDVFKLYLKWAPARNDGEMGDEFTCAKFIVTLGDAEEMPIPAFENWSYTFFNGIDENSQVFGIDHSKFENLTMSNGDAISTDKAYHVYNTFIDFHSFCNIFAEPTSEGKGIQNLNRIGQKIVHAAAFTQPPTHLGENISTGSFFKNGEITLEFKGLSIANDRTCALVGFDSGESSFKMIVKPMPDLEVVAVGSSHYWGDIYKDLQSGWVQKVTFGEVVVTEATMPMPPNKINSVVERKVEIRNVNKIEFFNY